MATRNVVDLIIAKRNGRALEARHIHQLIDAYTAGAVPDYQMSAFLMAAFLQGMDEEETLALTDAMLHSGIRIDLSSIEGTRVGKHSTGGVGDKISLILAPVVASCGVPVPKISGRGLGFTGGTLDKLESISGFRTDLSVSEYVEQLGEIGIVITGQTDEIAPADRALYALRDVTGTVDFIPFIASSIMSKKLAEGIDALVLDVKCGSGAFMKDEPSARKLAETLVTIGERFGVRTVAWMTEMNAPLGRAIGNWPEVIEAIECLQGAGPPDVMEVVRTLAGEMIHLGGQATSMEDGRDKAKAAMDSGRACELFERMVERQGGDVSLVRHYRKRDGFVPASRVKSPRDGYVGSIDGLKLGRASTVMGAGRMRKEDMVDPLAGIILNKRPGDAVRRGEVLASLFTKRTDALDHFKTIVLHAIRIQDEPPKGARSVLLDRFADGRWQGA